MVKVARKNQNNPPAEKEGTGWPSGQLWGIHLILAARPDPGPVPSLRLRLKLVGPGRFELLDQWRNEAGRFLGIAKRKEVGIWRGATRRLTRKLDIAMLPSLTRVENYAALFEGYGLVVVDECHHVPAATFEALLKACPCRKIFGLTATPVRKDGLEKLLHLQCDPVRHSIHFSPQLGLPQSDDPLVSDMRGHGASP